MGMKATGIVRIMDNLGRVVIPKELRRTLEINEGDGLAFFTDGEYIVMQKHAPGCIFCGEAANIQKFKGKDVCIKCKQDIKAE